MKNQQGKMSTRLLIFVAIVAIAVWVLMSLMPTWMKAMTFKDHLKNLASYAGSWPFTQDVVMADSMARAAKEAGVPEFTKDYFLHNIQRNPGAFRVKTHYERDNMLLGTNYRIKHWIFDWDIQQGFVGP